MACDLQSVTSTHLCTALQARHTNKLVTAPVHAAKAQQALLADTVERRSRTPWLTPVAWVQVAYRHRLPRLSYHKAPAAGTQPFCLTDMLCSIPATTGLTCPQLCT